jgi:superfamily II DNA or RNA helicase
MTDIVIQGSQARFITIDKTLNERLETLFSYEVQGAEYSEAYKEGKWNGVQYIFRKGRFPLGLLESVTRELQGEDIDYNIKDYRTLGKNIEINTDSNILRGYQQLAVDKALEERIPNFQGRMASLQLSTGAGKTFVIGELIARLGYSTLVLVPSIEILTQIQEMLSNYLCMKVGIIGNKQYEPSWVTVSTWQSLASKSWDYSDYLKKIDTLIIDESQHLGAPILRQICNTVPAIFRFSCSGTAFREDGADLYIEATTGPVVYTVGYSELIQQGYLVKPHIRILRFPQKQYHHYDSYSDIYDDYVTNNEFRNAVLIETAKEYVNEGRKVLIFVSRISHGKELARIAGHDFVYSSHPDRRKLINEFKNGELKCLISTSILNEGVDIPPINALILAAPQKSLIATVQKVGRALRPYENKKDCIVVDTYDNCKYLSKASQRRIGFYLKEPEFIMEKSIDTSTYGQEKLDEWGI